MSLPVVHVVACVLVDAVGRVLITQRPEGKAMAGAWEFPGGKVEAGEARMEAVRREIREEVGLEVVSARPLIRVRHRYDEFEVDLDVWISRGWRGEEQSCDGQALAWEQPGELTQRELLPADGPVVAALRLPERIIITPDAGPGGRHRGRITDFAGSRSAILVRCRSATHRRAWLSLARETVPDLPLILHGDQGATDTRDATSEPSAVHLSSEALLALDDRPDLPLVGASCHDLAQVEHARNLGLDYLFVSPVQATASHPGQPALGWTNFGALAQAAGRPTYALGGVGPRDLEQAWAVGGQGVAGISAFWGEGQG